MQAPSGPTMCPEGQAVGLASGALTSEADVTSDAGSGELDGSSDPQAARSANASMKRGQDGRVMGRFLRSEEQA